MIVNLLRTAGAGPKMGVRSAFIHGQARGFQYADFNPITAIKPPALRRFDELTAGKLRVLTKGAEGTDNSFGFKIKKKSRKART